MTFSQIKKILVVVAVTVAASLSAHNVSAWDYVWGDPGPENYSVYQDVALSLDGTTYAVGFFSGEFHGLTSPTTYRRFIERINSDGSIEWTQFLNDENFTTLPDEAVIEIDGDGKIFVAMSTFRTILEVIDVRELNVLVFDSSGTVLRQWWLGAQRELADTSKNHIVGLPNGGVAISIPVRVDETSEFKVQKLSLDSEAEWTYELGSDVDYGEAAELAVAADGSIWMVGAKHRTLPTLNDAIVMFHLASDGTKITSVKNYVDHLGPLSLVGVSDAAVWIASGSNGNGMFAQLIDAYSAVDGSWLGKVEIKPSSIGPYRNCQPIGTGKAISLGMNGQRLISVDACSSDESTFILVQREIRDPLAKDWSVVAYRDFAEANSFMGIQAIKSVSSSSNEYGESVFLTGYTDGLDLVQSLSPTSKLRAQSATPNLSLAMGNPVGSLYYGLRSARARTEILVAGRHGVPFGAKSAALTVTASSPRSNGNLVVWPCDKPRPIASSVSYLNGKSATNTVWSALSADGKVCVYNTAATHLVVDVNGRGVDNSDYVPLQPVRLMDTLKPGKTVDGKASGIGRRNAGSATELQVTGRGRVADDAETVVLNVSTSVPSISGFVTVYPCGSRRPAQESVNYSLWQNTSNMVVTKVGAGGKACIYTSAATDLQVDVVGYTKSSSSLRPVTPARLLDSRIDSVRTVDGKYWKIGRRAANSVAELEVTGRGQVASDASSVVLTVGAINPTAAGTLKVYQCGISSPNVISVSYLAGATTRTTVLAKVGTGGKVCIKTSQETDLTVDVNAYIGPDGTFAAVKPVRAVNTAVK